LEEDFAMQLDPRIHAWLDAWEQAQRQEPATTLEEFIRSCCCDGPPELIEAFRGAVRALEQMDGLLALVRQCRWNNPPAN
jgi:hypothetical protein